MRKSLFFILILSSATLSAQNQKLPVAIPGQFIVVLKESFATPVSRSGSSIGRSANAPNKELRKQNLDKIKDLQVKQKISTSSVLFDYADAMVGFSARLSDAEAEALKKDPAVAGVYQDQKLELAYTVRSEMQRSPGVQVEDCAVTTSGGHADGSLKFTWIWILDTGIDTDHPDLNVQSHGPYPASFSGASFQDLNGHGTHVAGIAAGEDNGIGVVGMSAGATVVPVKVIDNEGFTDYSKVIAGLNHVAQYSIPGDVVNLSLGGFEQNCAASFTGLTTAIANLANVGVWICIAAGNSSDNAEQILPGCINHKRVFTVAALGCDNSCAAFNCLGSNVDWYAVGVNVFSTYKDGGYSTLSGTSMATPVVAGIVHSRGQAPVRGPDVTCQIQALGITTTKPLARRQ